METFERELKRLAKEMIPQVKAIAPRKRIEVMCQDCACYHENWDFGSLEMENLLDLECSHEYDVMSTKDCPCFTSAGYISEDEAAALGDSHKRD